MSSVTATTTSAASASSTASLAASTATDDRDCWGLACSSSWEWARWVIFVLFMLIVLVFVIATIRINYIRRRNGQEPLRYVSWLGPPSYRQSERARNRTDVPLTDYVPPYTEEANENDLGYYDRDGIFHVNSKAEPPPPIDACVLEHRTDRTTDVDLEMQQVRPVEDHVTEQVEDQDSDTIPRSSTGTAIAPPPARATS